MNEDQLRALVREAIAKHLGHSPSAASSHLVGAAAPSPARSSAASHPSHGLFVLAATNDSGACVIEPSVSCTHCGYCKSMGH
jgi:hypothetical protein